MGELPNDPPLGSPEGRRIVKLLWDPPDATPARGPRPKISLAEIVDTGVAIADAEGIDALSMRKVAGRLGVGAMSLYTYLPGRFELIELMIDRVYADHAMVKADRLADSGEKEVRPRNGANSVPEPPSRGPGREPSADAGAAAETALSGSVGAGSDTGVVGWRHQVESWMHATWRVYVQHPWLLDYNMARLPIGPNVLDVEESLYAAVLAAGFDAADNVALSNLIRWQLLGAARAMIGDEVEERHTGVSVEAYWESRFSFWSTYFDEARFPTMAAIWAKGGFDDPTGYDVDRMITWLLDGVERLAAATLPDRGAIPKPQRSTLTLSSYGSAEVQVIPTGGGQPECGQADED